MYGVIYKITNKVNGKVYIGQTRQTIKVRFSQHYNLALKIKKMGKHLNYWQNSLLKYGKDNFTIEQIDVANSFEELNDKEIYWIAFYNATNYECGYNRTNGGYCGCSWDVMSEEQKQSMLMKLELWRKEHPEEFRKSCARPGSKNGMYGRKHSESTRKKISEKQKLHIQKYGNQGINEEANKKRSKTLKGHTLTNETKDKIREKNKSHIWVYNDVGKMFIHKDQLQEFLDKGFKIGIGKIKSKHIGQRLMVSNGFDSIMVYESDIEIYLQNGYKHIPR